MADRFTKTIMMRLLRGKMTQTEASWALNNPEAYKAKEKERSLTKDTVENRGRWPGNYYHWGYLTTPRLRVRYCWAKHRNTAGYFLGWRETFDKNGKLKDRDQIVARKVKWRLKELQRKRNNALITKGASGTKR